MEEKLYCDVPEKSLRSRIINRLLIQVIGIMTIVMVTVSFILLSALRQEKITALSERASHAVKRMEQQIYSLNSSVVNFSRNHFIINSLVHSQGREEYLFKMMEDFGKLDKIHSVSMVDYAGKLIHSNIPDPPDYKKILYLQPSLETARSMLQLSRDKKNIILVEPVLHYDTPIGAIIAEINVKDLISHILSEDKNIYYKLYSMHQEIYSYNFDATNSYIVTPHTTQQHEIPKLSSLELEIEMGVLDSILLKSIWIAVFQLLGLSFIFFILTFIFATRIGDEFTGPILKMIKKIIQSEKDPTIRYSPIGTGDELEILAGALDSRESQLWEYRENLEDQVTERTRELTLAKEEAETNARKIKEFVQDLGEKNRELQTARKKADQANFAKSEFLANMSHEIRTPLNAVIGFSEILNNLVTDKKQRSFLHSIRTSGKSLLTLINDILDLSKIEAGKLELQYEDASMRHILEEIRQIFSLKLDEKFLDLRIEISPEIPEVLILDEIRIRQVLLNIVGNAIKFTDNGYISIKLTSEHPDKVKNSLDLVISVRDTGIGIPESQKEAIFNTFVQQEGQSTRKYGGTGLGLSITRRLVEMMNGEITLESTVGKGTTFFIKIHGISISTVKKLKSDYQKKFNLADIKFDPALILIVDDIESNRHLVESLMTQAGLNSIQAESGEQAVVLAVEKQPDLILMDIRMPLMNGYEATQKIREHPDLKHIPIIALTASVKTQEKENILTQGFDGYLSKPIDVDLLFFELSKYLTYTTVPSSSRKDEDPCSAQVNRISIEKIKDLSAFVTILKTQYIPKWHDLNGAMEMSDLEDFADNLKELAIQHNVECLITFSNQILGFIENFEVEELQSALGTFPDKVKQLEQLK